MKFYKVNFRLDGILIFSSEVRPAVSRGEKLGSYISPLPYIHNYPVIYGMLGKSAEVYFVRSSTARADYEDRKTNLPFKLKYTTVEETIENGKNGRGFYIFPLFPKEIITSSFFLSSEIWSYSKTIRYPTKNVFPRVTSYTAFMPESRFYTYMVTDDEFEIPEWIRIGKKRWGIMRVEPKELEIKGIKDVNDCETSIPVNVKDTEEFGYKILKQAKVLETPSIKAGVIAWATIEKCYSLLTKDGEVTLPIPPGFLK